MRIKEYWPAFSLAVFLVFGLPSLATAQEQGIAYQTDYFGNDIVGRDIAGGDWAACQALCIAEPRCVVWTLYTPPSGNVGGWWLKHTKGPAQTNQYSISGTRASTSSPSDIGANPSAPSSQSH